MRPRSVLLTFHPSCHVDVHTTCHMVQTNLFKQHCTMKTADQKQNKRFDTESGVQQVLAKPHTHFLSYTHSLTHSRTNSITLSLSYTLSLSLTISLSFLVDAEWRAPNGVTSEATQHCCENNCHNIHYHENWAKINLQSAVFQQTAPGNMSKFRSRL